VTEIPLSEGGGQGEGVIQIISFEPGGCPDLLQLHTGRDRAVRVILKRNENNGGRGEVQAGGMNRYKPVSCGIATGYRLFLGFEAPSL
jgi:hypothetical protein